MTAKVLLRRNTRSAWLRMRTRGLGGTDVAAVLGFDSWRTQLDVWLDKTGRADRRSIDSYPIRRGHHMERMLLDEYGRTTGAWIERAPDLPALLAHPEHPWLRASLDGLAHHPDRTVVVDAKTAGWRGREAWWDPERLCPDQYAVQMLTYLAVTGLEEAVLVADVAGEFTTVTVMRDLAWEARALPLLDAWWTRHVLGDEPPPIDYDRDSIPALNRTWVPEPGTSVEASPAVRGALGAYCGLHPKWKERERTLAALKVQIREGMGTAQTLTVDGVKAAALDSRGVLRVTYKEEGNA
jgi:putative phage-type endonuclease